VYSGVFLRKKIPSFRINELATGASLAGSPQFKPSFIFLFKATKRIFFFFFYATGRKVKEGILTSLPTIIFLKENKLGSKQKTPEPPISLSLSFLPYLVGRRLAGFFV